MLEKKTVHLSEMHTEEVRQAKLKLCFTELNMIVARGMGLEESSSERTASVTTRPATKVQSVLPASRGKLFFKGSL